MKNLKTLAIRIWQPPPNRPPPVRRDHPEVSNVHRALDALATAANTAPQRFKPEGLAQIIDYFINGIDPNRKYMPTSVTWEG